MITNAGRSIRVYDQDSETSQLFTSLTAAEKSTGISLKTLKTMADSNRPVMAGKHKGCTAQWVGEILFEGSHAQGIAVPDVGPAIEEIFNQETMRIRKDQVLMQHEYPGGMTLETEGWVTRWAPGYTIEEDEDWMVIHGVTVGEDEDEEE